MAAGEMERAARAELRQLPSAARTGLLAKAVLNLARRVDAGTTVRDAALAIREMRVTLDALAASTPARAVEDKADELTRKREQRIRDRHAAG
jgi:hypothetical protein